MRRSALTKLKEMKLITAPSSGSGMDEVMECPSGGADGRTADIDHLPGFLYKRLKVCYNLVKKKERHPKDALF